MPTRTAPKGLGGRDSVFIAGQALGLLVYTRNLMLIRRERCEDRLPRMG
jgi:lipid-A-disaccharide synthase-like uncharacterized protein